MTEWDVDDRMDFQDFQEEAREDAYREAHYDEQEEAFERTALRCGSCGFRWSPNWEPRSPDLRAKVLANPGACPACGSLIKAAR